MTDEEIVILYQNGNNDAIQELIRRYTSPLYNFVVRIAGKSDAQDVVQESFIKVWKNLGQFDSRKASFKTWIFKITKNTATDFLRKKKSLVFSDISTSGENNKNEDGDNDNFFADNIPDEAILPDAALQKLGDKEFLNATLEKLRPSYREILTLHYQEEMTFDEIGKILDKPLNTVKSDHRRAIIELRELLGNS